MKEVLQQTKLLLGRNIALRLRQPVILALELLWPVSIFLVVMAARKAIPPVSQPTCHYRAWALPSAGVVPFVQSMICNIDECQNRTEYEDTPTYQGSSVRDLVSHTLPLLVDRNITDLVDALPRGMRLLRAAVDALSSPHLAALLGDGFPVRKLVRDSERTRGSLRDIGTPPEDIDAILDSSIQLPQLLEFARQSDDKCDPRSRQQTRDVLESLRVRLCSLETRTRKEFFRQLGSQLDVKNIVQTMGLAMSQFGRLDVGEILNGVVGLLAHVQSADFLRGEDDARLRLATTLIEGLRAIDARLLHLVIDDLEPLYGDSDWAPLVRVFKDIELPGKTPDTNTSGNKNLIEMKENEVAATPGTFEVNNPSNMRSNTSDVVKTVLDLLETALDVVAFLPEQTSLRLRAPLKFLPLFVDTAEELKHSMETDNSTEFINTLSEVAGAAFFISIAEESKTVVDFTTRGARKNFCDSKEFHEAFHSSEWRNNLVLQRHLCRASRAGEEVRKNSSSADMKTSLSKLRRILNAETYPDILRNLDRWDNETDVSKMPLFSKMMTNVRNVDDVITAFECGIRGLQDIFQKQSFVEGKNKTTHHALGIARKIDGQKLALIGIAGLKEISKHLRFLPVWSGRRRHHSGDTDSGHILSELYSLLLHPAGDSLSSEHTFSTENTNATLQQHPGRLPALVSVLLRDVETSVWEAITPKMVEEFSSTDASRQFCVDTETLEATQLHWKWMLCEGGGDAAVRIQLPPLRKNVRKKEENSTALSAAAAGKSSFGFRDVGRLLLRVSADSGFLLRTAARFLDPVAAGCGKAACGGGGGDSTLGKMCVLGRLQNVRDAVRASLHRDSPTDDIAEQLHPLIPAQEDVLRSYDSFVDALRACAANNDTDGKDIAQLVVSGLRFLDSLEGSHEMRPALRVASNLVSLLKNRLSDAAQHAGTGGVVSIRNVFPDSPLTQELVRSLLPSLPQIASTALWTAAANGKMWRVVRGAGGKNASAVLGVLCNASSLSDYLYNPALSEREFALLRESLCRHRYYDVFEEVFQDPDIQEMAFETSSSDDFSWDDLHDNLLEVTSLLRNLRGSEADLSSLPTPSRWREEASRLQTHIRSPSVLLHLLLGALFSESCEHPHDPASASLCALTEANFAEKVASKVEEALGRKRKYEEEEEGDVSGLAEEVWRGVAAVPEVKEVFGWTEGGSPRSEGWRERWTNVTERVFDLVDGASNGRLSESVLGSLIPEFLEDFNVTLSDSNLNEVSENGSDKTSNASLPKNPETRRLESYVRTLADHFSDEAGAGVLSSACGRSPESAGHLGRMACSRTPSEWSADLLGHANFTELWADPFLPAETRNATRATFFGRRRVQFVDAVVRLLRGSLLDNRTSASSLFFDLARTLVATRTATGRRGPSCVTRSTEAAVRYSTHKLTNSIRDSGTLCCGLLNKNISEFYSWFSKSSDLKTALEMIANGTKSGEECRHSGQWVTSSLIDDLEHLSDTLLRDISDEELSKARHCLSNFRHSPLFASIDVHADVLRQTARVLSSADGIWKGGIAKEKIVESVGRHLPAFLQLAEVLPWSQLQEEESLANTSIHFHWLRRRGFSSVALRREICETRDSKVFSYPPHGGAAIRRGLDDFFCRGNRTDQLLARLNRTAIAIQVSAVQEREFFSGGWFRQLANSSHLLVDLGARLVSALRQVRGGTFGLLLVLSDLAESFEKLTEVLDPVFPASSLIETLQQIADGLDSLNSLAKLSNFSFVASAGEVFGEAASRGVLSQLMDPASVDTVLKTDIDLREVGPGFESSALCAAGPLAVLCSDPRTAHPSDGRIREVVYQKLLRSLGGLGVEGVLRAAGVDAGDAGRTLAVLSSAPTVMATLSRHLQTITTLLHPEVGEVLRRIDRDPDWLRTPAALSLGGRILCGRPLASLSKKFRLLAPDAGATDAGIENRELRRLPTDFCRRGYREIMGMRGGAILWGLLKPLFRGKILFAPKNDATAKLVVAKVNETFGLLEESMRFVRSAAEGTTGLHYLQRKNETLHSLRQLLMSRPFSELVGGASSSQWASALSWLEESGGDGGGSVVRSALRLVEVVGEVTRCISLDRFLGFDTEEAMEAAAATLHDRREFIAALVFMKDEEEDEGRRTTWEGGEATSSSPLPRNVLYKIRMDIDNVPTTEYIKYRWWRPYPYDDFFEDLRYFRGFVQLQDTVDGAITQLQLGFAADTPTSPPKKYLQQFPYPCHQRDRFGTLLKGSMPAVMTISWVFLVAFLVRERVLDRELRTDETLRVMGVRGASAWLAWFVSGACALLASVCGIAAVLKWGGVTPNSDPALLLLFVADFALLLLAYCHLMSGFFGRASTAALLSVLLYVLSFFPFLLFVTWEINFLHWHKILSCCLVSTSFCFGCLYLNRYEDQGEGVQWSNLWRSPVAGDRMNFGTALVAMLACSLLYFAAALLLPRMRRGFRGRKPFAWCAVFRPPSGDASGGGEGPRDNADSKNASGGDGEGEEAPGIRLRDVHALYQGGGRGGEWRALSGLSLEMRAGSITALLGHNGAGKTTTIRIVTGRLQPTSGSVSVCGLALPRHTEAARRLIGFCPQTNTLYDKLTVREHLNLFARLKGLLDEQSVEKDVNEMLDRLRLREKRDACAASLSGGQRRRLCVGVAFVGGSRVVVLDEPTSSVDPVARRGIWDIILSYREGRTILFTTHHLDEADILSDRVAILHRGRVLCCGSPLELKSRFGSGYRLRLLPHPDDSSPEVDDNGAVEFVRARVPNATLLECAGGRVELSLPAEPLALAPLSPLLRGIEERLRSWGFHACAVSTATLEEVFLTLCRLEDAKVAAHNPESSNEKSPFRLHMPRPDEEKSIPTDEKAPPFVAEVEPPPASLFRLKCVQLRALVRMRACHARRDWRALAAGLLLPTLFIGLAMGLAVGRPRRGADSTPDPPMQLTPRLYSEPAGGVSFFRFENSKSALGKELLTLLNADHSHEEICLEGNSSCGGVSSAGPRRCLCERECRRPPWGHPSPSSHLTAPGHHLLYNMSGVDIPAYLLASYLQFNEKRYGGWTLGGGGEEEEEAKVWFENSGYHSAPAYLNTLNNAVLRRTRPDLGIRTWSHPLRLSVEQLGRETLFHRLGEVGISFVFLIGLSLVPCTAAVGVVAGRGARRVQRACGGVGPLLHWASSLVADALLLLVPAALLAALVVALFRLPAFTHRENFAAVCALVALYGWSTTPLTYLCSRAFDEGSLAFMVLFTSHLFVGLVVMLALVSLRMIGLTEDVAGALRVVRLVALALPQYCLVGGLTDLNENQIRAEIFAQFGQDAYASPFSWGGIAPHLAALAAQGALFFALTVAADCWGGYRPWNRILGGGRKSTEGETRKGGDSTPPPPLLRVRNVSQVYHTKAGLRYAVDHLSLAIPRGECFGLVGANGAGKTTLFRMLTGEMRPGDGRIDGPTPPRCGSPSPLGYCPQEDALDGLLSARQHLRLYAGLRGFQRHAHTVVSRSLTCFGLESHADLPASALSGGTKRKLCTAIAMLGDPQLVLLDEPTSGMDPATRRLVWRRIARATQEEGSAVVLTSHSIEDCDVLCSRLGIMVNGKLACVDTTQRLKARTGGYTLSFRIPGHDGKEDTLLDAIRSEISSARLQVRSGTRAELSLPFPPPLSVLFARLEECARSFGIHDVALQPTTLDQVFVNFVRQQSEDAETRHQASPESELSFEMCSTKL